MKRLVVQQRERTYKHPTEEEHQRWAKERNPSRERRPWITHGTEIVREIKVCPDCAAKAAAQEPSPLP